MSLTSSPWLSILLPVYKVEAFLEDCAKSILSQADAGVELIFVDDASPDGSAGILADLQASHQAQVQVIRHERNQGLSAARNTALAAARGDYLWFVDSDDLLEPGALASLKAVIEADTPDLILCDFRAFDDEANPDCSSQPRYAHIPTFKGLSRSLSRDRSALIAGLFEAGQLHSWSKIVKRLAWPEGLLFPVGRTFEDLAVSPGLALHAQSFVHMPEVWLAYRQRAGSILAQLSAVKIEDWMLAMVGFGQQLNAAQLPAPEEAVFQVAHFNARTFIRACKRFVKLGGQATDSQTLARFARHWQASSPLNAQALSRAYLKRGLWLRAMQLHYWVWRAGR
ncbi:glycosyltransferase family 2 protein [Paucibacter sp. Y2R2-4]|uniref:glycosyltransferase family 2 protein n=1 Tax=Paucibacter sp. Y2R2-4 TaxID=2893553 RepID=UPI0021E3FE58|nr:glycosyltransferase family 2 protein [Paucibacter sp. Y2R2-4]MCV2348729.1 glycosyltransferase [Paucibacter sp. Y2R2-4]